MLAAGRGSRLSGDDESHPPKSLLKFGGRSLLQRHIEILKSLDVAGLNLVVGYRRADIEAELRAIGAHDFVELINNPDFHDGSLVSLWCARELLTGGDDVLLMDADVLYPSALLQELARPGRCSRMPYDRTFEAGDEPVKLCLLAGRAVEFRKIVDVEYDIIGEWPGFVRLSAAAAGLLAMQLQEFIDRADTRAPYEEALRRVLLSANAEFEFSDITGMPWIEIDFAEDVVRAEREILPAIEKGS